VSGPLLCHTLRDFEIAWHKCLPHQDDVSHPRPLSQVVKFAINSTSFHKNNIKQLATYILFSFLNIYMLKKPFWGHLSLTLIALVYHPFQIPVLDLMTELAEIICTSYKLYKNTVDKISET
jgi:hypothetical protein